MKTTAEADEYLRSPACHKHLVGCLKHSEEQVGFHRNGGWYLEIDPYGVWHRVQIGWIDEDTGDFVVDATAYYHAALSGQFVVTDLGDGLREVRVEMGAYWMNDISAGQFENFVHRQVNQGTVKDLPLVDFSDGMVTTRLNVGPDQLPAAICRVMLGSMRLAKMRP